MKSFFKAIIINWYYVIVSVKTYRGAFKENNYKMRGRFVMIEEGGSYQNVFACE